MTISNRITGIVQLTRPLHCATPDRENARSSSETPTAFQRIHTRKGVDTVPYFPGNDLRGRLRRKAAALVLDHITVAGKVKTDLYAGLTCGAVGATVDSVVTVEEALRARNDVYMGLFGGGARLLRSRYRVADLLPVLASTVEAGCVPSAYGQDDERNWLPMNKERTGPLAGVELIDRVNFFRVDDLFRVVRPDELGRYVENAAEAVAEQQAQTLISQMRRKDDKAKARSGEIRFSEVAGKADVGNMLSFQVIPAGTRMYFQLDFADDVTDAHVGLMLLALRALVREQALGGWIRAGLGQFTAELTMDREGNAYPVFAEKNHSSAAGADADLAPAVEPFVKAAEEGLRKLTIGSMTEFFIPRKSANNDEEGEGEGVGEGQDTTKAGKGAKKRTSRSARSDQISSEPTEAA